MEKRYIPNGEVQGDDRNIPETLNGHKGNYDKSLAGEVSRSDLHPSKGFSKGENISSTSKSDKE